MKTVSRKTYEKAGNSIQYESFYDNESSWCDLFRDCDYIAIAADYLPRLTPAQARRIAAWLVDCADRIDAEGKVK